MIIFLPLLVGIIGTLIFALVKNNADVKEIGHVLMWTGYLAFLIVYHGQLISVR